MRALREAGEDMRGLGRVGGVSVEGRRGRLDDGGFGVFELFVEALGSHVLVV